MKNKHLQVCFPPKRNNNFLFKMTASVLKDDHYLQGGFDYDFIEGLDPRLECSICLLCLRNPHQTSCGHLFCHQCILTWIQQNKLCPIDKASLGQGNIFGLLLRCIRDAFEMFWVYFEMLLGCTGLLLRCVKMHE